MEVEGEAALGRMVVPEGPDSSDLQDCGAPAELLLSVLGRLGTVGQGDYQHGDTSLWPSRKVRSLWESQWCRIKWV